MPSQSYSNPSVQSSPAKGERPRTYDHSRQPGIEDQRLAEEEREDDMDDCVDTSIPLTPSEFQTKYLPVPGDFDICYPEERIETIRKAFEGKITTSRKAHEGEKSQTTGTAAKKRPLEKAIVQAWVEMNDMFNLFPGYILHQSEDTPEVGDKKHLKVDATLIAESERERIVKNAPNWALSRFPIEFKRGGREYDPFDDREGHDVESPAGTRRHVRGQLMSYARKVCSSQHRTKLFQLLVNGEEFRMLRWDRSGVCFTPAINYVESVANMRLLLEFVYGFTKLDNCAQGLDHTAIPLSRNSCGWKRMDILGLPSRLDLEHGQGSLPKDFKLPPGFTLPSADASISPLFEGKHLHHDPTAVCDSLIANPSPCAGTAPVWRYMRELFGGSLSCNHPRYQITVDGRKFLVGKPIFEANGMVGRGTRGYIALDWDTQQFVFLKDAWRPSYDGVDKEGDVLSKLNQAGVPNVPTLITHGDVCERDGTEQETETSKWSPVYTAQTAQAPLTAQTQRRKIIPLRSSRPTTTVGPVPPVEVTIPVLSASMPEVVHGPSNPMPHSDKSARGVKRSVKDVQAEDRRPGSGLRHMIHYRIVVAEVCLPSTAFTRGRSWASVVWNCLQAHAGAYEKCNVIHRDVSVGNILIRPTLISDPAGKIVGVFWTGLLTDWELAKDASVTHARQPVRTGTWQFMSLWYTMHPDLPVTISDELESFFHVLLYNSIRFLVHNFQTIHTFIHEYFDNATINPKLLQMASLLKDNVITSGQIKFGDEILRFYKPEGTEGEHPMNELIRRLLELFCARYRVLQWEAAKEAESATRTVQQEVLHAVPLLSSDTQGKITDDALFNFAYAPQQRPTQDAGHDSLKHKIRAKVTAVAQPSRPSDRDLQLATSLKTHKAVLEIFEELVLSSNIWPEGGDTVADRLHGFRQAPRIVPSTNPKPPKQAKTVPVDRPSLRLAETDRDVVTETQLA